MSKTDWKKNSLPTIFKKAKLWNFKKGDVVTVLDVACGLSLKSKFIDAKIRVGVDIYEPYFDHIESDVPYVVIKYDVRKLEEIFLPNSFDLVIAIDIIEHLEKHEGLSLIKQCEEIAKKAVIVETPNGYIYQNIDILGFGGHTWQTHRSGWEVRELQDLGYRTTARDYRMADIKRHTNIDVDPNVQIIDAIKYL